MRELQTVARPERISDDLRDLGVVRDVVENHLGDLLDFVAAIRRRL